MRAGGPNGPARPRADRRLPIRPSKGSTHAAIPHRPLCDSAGFRMILNSATHLRDSG
jgi:hypothetical protein